MGTQGEHIKKKLSFHIASVHTAFMDVVSTRGWVKKVIQLALLSLVPIFGPLVMNGYLYGWARDASENPVRTLPRKIFGNEDGRLYSRGFYTLIIELFYSIVPILVYIVLLIISRQMLMASTDEIIVFSAYQAFEIQYTIRPSLQPIFDTVEMIFIPIIWVATIRMSKEQSLKAGLQLRKVFSMIRKGFFGLLVIFVVYVLAAVAVSVAIQVLSSMFLFSTLLRWLFTFVLILLTATFITMVFIRAIGYWASQLEVSSQVEKHHVPVFNEQEDQAWLLGESMDR